MRHHYNITLLACAAMMCGADASAAGLKDFFAQSEQTKPRKSSSSVCKAYQALADNALPKQARSKEELAALAKQAVHSFAFSEITPAQLATAVEDASFKQEKNSCEKPDDKASAFCDDDGTRRLTVNARKGALRYINPERGFNPLSGKSIALTQEKASAIAVGAVRLSGIPETEIISRTHVRTLTIAGNSKDGGEPTAPLRAEQHVSVGRVLNGLPVFDSEAKIAVSATGEIARLALRWPDAQTPPSLSGAVPRAEKNIMNDVAVFLRNIDTSCTAYASVNAFVAYAPIDEESPFYENSAGEDDTRDNISLRYYMPQLVVYAAPGDGKEDSGELTPPGVQVTVPLYTRKPVSRKKEG